ncbi:MAG: dTDP-4-dehydrorhamnose reductase [Anaerolineae bacterium]
MKIIVAGAKGRLGSRVVEVLNAAAHSPIPTDLPELELTDFSAVRTFVGDHRPDAVIHCAAWTDVDGCAREPEKAVRINGLATGTLASITGDLGIPMAYVSSNEVFDGTAGRAYLEYDPTRPINPYGYSKWVGEQALIRTNPRHWIMRTSWLFAHGGKNFIQSILNAAKAGKPLRVVVNEIANPTYNDDLAEAIVNLIGVGRFGTYHLVNEGYCSRYAFARYALDRAGYTDTLIQPISATEWQRPSIPPEFSPLVNLAAAEIGVQLRSWQQAVDAFLEKEGLLKTL